MNISIFTSKYPYKVHYKNYLCGGSILVIKHLVNILKNNNNISIYSTNINKNTIIETHKNLKIYRYGTNIRFLSQNISLKKLYHPILQKHNLLYLNFDSAPGSIEALIIKILHPSIKMVLHYHGDWVSDYGSIFRRIFIFISNIIFTRLYLKLSSNIIVPTKIYINNSKYLSRYSNKIFVLRNGIELDNIIKYRCKKEKVDSICFIGNIEVYKGVDILLKAVDQLIQNNIIIELNIIGKGTLLKNYKQKYKQNKYIHFFGYVSEEKKLNILSKSKIFCLPSKKNTESFGIVNLEAMALGIPIIASNIGGIPDIVKDNRNGLLFSSGNIDDLKSKILLLLKDIDLYEKIKRNNLSDIDNYNWKNIADELELFLKNI